VCVSSLISNHKLLMLSQRRCYERRCDDITTRTAGLTSPRHNQYSPELCCLGLRFMRRTYTYSELTQKTTICVQAGCLLMCCSCASGISTRLPPTAPPSGTLRLLPQQSPLMCMQPMHFQGRLLSCAKLMWDTPVHAAWCHKPQPACQPHIPIEDSRHAARAFGHIGAQHA
jgi:hypothetical protein